MCVTDAAVMPPLVLMSMKYGLNCCAPLAMLLFVKVTVAGPALMRIAKTLAAVIAANEIVIVEPDAHTTD